MRGVYIDKFPFPRVCKEIFTTILQNISTPDLDEIKFPLPFSHLKFPIHYFGQNIPTRTMFGAKIPTRTTLCTCMYAPRLGCMAEDSVCIIDKILPR